MAGSATYLPHFFLDSGISTWTIFYGTRTTTTTTTTTTSLNHLYKNKPIGPSALSQTDSVLVYYIFIYNSSVCTVMYLKFFIVF